MPGALFSYEFDGAALEGRLSQAAVQMGELSPLMATLGAILEQSAKDRIQDTNTSPDGAAWPKSLRATVEGGKTLLDSGLLAASIHNIPGRDRVEIGTNLIYAGVHQFGATIRAKTAKGLFFALPGTGDIVIVQSVTIPARPYLGASEVDREDIADAAADFVRDVFEAPQ